MASEPSVLCEGLEFPEGPVFMDDGSLYVTELIGQRVSKVADGKFTVLAQTGGAANGMTLGPDGALYVSNNGGIAPNWNAPEPFSGRIQKVTLDGRVTDVATNVDGEPLVSPNDLCFGPDGLLYFTDPRWTHGQEMQTQGRVCRTDMQGNVEILHEGGLFTNGLAFSPAGDRLYVALTYEQRLFFLPWDDGRVGAPQDFCRLPAGFPDGFCLDADGRLYVAATIGWGVQVFEPDGTHVELLEVGEGSLITNCAFGPDGGLAVTDSGKGRVVRFDVGRQGLALR